MTSTHVAAAPPAYQSPQRVTQARVLRSEWTKLRTQPSVRWALLSAVILVIGFGVGYSLLRAARPPRGAAAAAFDPASVSLAGVQLAQIAAGVLGVLLITSEYATGLIRATFTAVPGAWRSAIGSSTSPVRRQFEPTPSSSAGRCSTW